MQTGSEAEEVFKALFHKGNIYTYLARDPVPLVDSPRLEEFLRDYELVFIYFTAEWCAPCIRLVPELVKASLGIQGLKAKIVRVDVDRSHELAHKYNVSRLPTLLVARKGRVVDSMSGSLTPETLRAFIDSYAKSLQ
ncbi:MAG: thioredoxin family protein [Desulfurococcales archaeon]|nr:thioredoxin family protein [Desulfurococcales archaeon]